MTVEATTPPTVRTPDVAVVREEATDQRARQAPSDALPAVEVLGSVTTVCSDKTGTLTKNEMTVRTMVTPVARYEVSGLGYDPTGEITPAGGGDLAALLAVADLCNDAHLEESESGGWTLVGEPTEGALKVVAMKGGAVDTRAQRIGVVPFDSAYKFMATLVEAPDPSPGSTAAAGTGGDYLSNESMYRSNRLRQGLHAWDVPGGHLHISALEHPADPTLLTDAAFEADRRAIVDQTVALVTAAASAVARRRA